MAGYKLDLGGGAFAARAARREERETDLSAPLGDRHFAAGWEAAARTNVDTVARPPLPSLAIDFPAAIDLAALDGSNGFRLDGIDANDYSGHSVSSAGDVNGDGFDDIIIGAYGGDSNGSYRAGESYVVFGHAGGFAAIVDFAVLDGANGFRIGGIDLEQSGRSVSSAGDVNGDGFGDIVIGAYLSSPGGDNYAGASYVVFGHADGFAASLFLAALDGANGFRIDGIDAHDLSGSSVSSAGDINGDGFDDIIIGAHGADGNAGESYVVFGKAGGFGASLDSASLDGSNGFRIDGIDANDLSGFSAASAGDVNGDGFDDVIIGAFAADRGGDSAAGESYVVFGEAGGFGASLALASLDGSNGFRIDGIDAYDYSGRSVSSAGDVNGDGFDDVIVGASKADANAGESYVVFGSGAGFASAVDLASLDGSNGFRIDGIDGGDRSGISAASAGDVNGDGFDDVIIGAYRADPGGANAAGASYVVFGKAEGFGASLDLASLDGSNGFRIDGSDGSDFSGVSVASAGDVDGDGFYDVIVGAWKADANGDSNAGESYVIFGRAPGEAVNRVGSAGGQTIRGGAFDDTLAGLGGGDELYGGGGADSLDGGAQSDLARGGDGNDVIFGDSVGLPGDDSLYGDAGADTIHGSFGVDIMNGGAGVDTLTLLTGIFGNVWNMATGITNIAGESAINFENAETGDFADSITGNSAANHIRTLGGDDTLAGAGGNDTLTGGEGADALTGGGGSDWANYGDASPDVVADLQLAANNTGDAAGDSYASIENLSGSTGADGLRGDKRVNILYGGDGNDSLDGHKGDDTLIGGLGKDKLTGGAGDDRFTLEYATAANRDTIQDFAAGDEIALLGAEFGLAPGALPAGRFVLGSAAGDGNDRIIYDAATGKLFFDSDGTGGQAQILIATFANNAPLTASDFIVI